jgi:hypothetical protein
VIDQSIQTAIAAVVRADASPTACLALAAHVHSHIIRILARAKLTHSPAADYIYNMALKLLAILVEPFTDRGKTCFDPLPLAQDLVCRVKIRARPPINHNKEEDHVLSYLRAVCNQSSPL